MFYWLKRLGRSIKLSVSFYKLLLLDHALFRIFSSDKDSANYPHNSFVLQKPSVYGENSIKPGACAKPRHRTSVHVIDCLFTLRWILKVLYLSTYNIFDLAQRNRLGLAQKFLQDFVIKASENKNAIVVFAFQTPEYFPHFGQNVPVDRAKLSEVRKMLGCLKCKYGNCIFIHGWLYS